MNIAITGASGFIGVNLTTRLRQDGHNVHAVSLRSVPEPAVFEGCDAVVHLAGEPVVQRWTAAAKRRILDSRVTGTRLVVDALAKLERRPSVLVSASGVGYYGSRGDDVLAESSAPGNDFLAQVCIAWEKEARKAETLGIRVVTPRIGMVLGAGGGALAKLLLPFRVGVGGRIGSGMQSTSWIHLDDLISLVTFAIQKPDLRGPLNAVAPQPVTNLEFTKVLAEVLHRPAIFPVPGFALKLLFGEMSEMLLGGQRAIPEAAQRAGFHFRYPRLEAALEQILGSA
jgi:uncharacterized protein (TIGR01777 family)